MDTAETRRRKAGSTAGVESHRGLALLIELRVKVVASMAHPAELLFFRAEAGCSGIYYGGP